MLQIISGKFFNKDAKINKDKKHEVLYSNFFCYSSIKTNVFELIPINSFQGKINKFIIIFENKYEPQEKDVLYLPTDEPIIYQIQYLLTFYFDAYFHKEKSHVEKFCTDNKNSKEIKNLASKHLPHIFELKKENRNDIDFFLEFNNIVISLERKKFNLLIKLLSAYYNSIESFETNYELSYMTLVYSLETLITENNQCEVIWNDYEQNKRNKLEKIFLDIEDENVHKIKEILTSDSNLKLKKQFVNGLLEMTGDDFFHQKDHFNGKKVLKSELLQVLNNLYSTRSKYVHKLDTLDKVIQTHGYDKTNFCYDRENPKFSIYGLMIFTKYIINTFIKNAKKLDNEKYNWREELPGIIKVNLAPQYWVWKHEGFIASLSTIKFNGFIELLVSSKIVDIKELLLKIEKLLGQLNEENFASAFSMYVMYNFLIDEKLRLENYDSIIKKYSSKVDKCFIQYLVMDLYLQTSLKWSCENIEETINAYYKNKYKKNSIILPNKIEVLLLSKTANMYLKKDNYIKFLEFMDRAILESINNMNNYELLLEVKSQNIEVDLEKLT